MCMHVVLAKTLFMPESVKKNLAFLMIKVQFNLIMLNPEFKIILS